MNDERAHVRTAVPEWLEQYVRRAPRAAAVVDGPGHRLLVANVAFRALVGGDAARALAGDSLSDLWPVDGGHALAALVDRARRAGCPLDEVVRLPVEGNGGGRDGTGDIWTCTVWPTADDRRDETAPASGLVIELRPAAELERVAALQRELAERAVLSALREVRLAEDAERAQVAAERQAAEHAAVIESIPDAVYIGNGDRITRANGPALAQLGVAAGDRVDLQARLPDAAAHPRDVAMGAAIGPDRHPFARALDGETAVAELLIRPPSSAEDRMIRAAAAPVRVDAHVVAAVVVATDVTEERRAEAALADARQSLELALEAAGMGTWDVDLASGTARTSPRHNEVFGYREPIAAWDPDVLRRHVVPEDRTRLDEALDRARATGAFELEARVRWPDGSVHWVQDRGRVYVDPDGRPVRMAGVTRDVTEVREAQEVLRRVEALAHAELEAHIAERTAELARANAALEAEAAARAQGAAERDALRRRLARAEEDERRRLARELHDEVGQHLTAVGLELQALTEVVPRGSEVDRRADALRALVDTLGRELHALAVQLRPRALDDFGLEAAVTSYAEMWSRQYAIPVAVRARVDADRLPSAIESAAYRIVQEALTNVARHSGATRAGVIVERRDGIVLVSVEDDGRGFDAGEPPAAGGLGILGIRERATLLGGSVEIESEPGHGTTVFVRIPIEQPAEEHGGV